MLGDCWINRNKNDQHPSKSVVQETTHRFFHMGKKQRCRGKTAPVVAPPLVHLTCVVSIGPATGHPAQGEHGGAQRAGGTGTMEEQSPEAIEDSVQARLDMVISGDFNPPKNMRVPPVIIHLNGIFPDKSPILGYPHLWTPPYQKIIKPF